MGCDPRERDEDGDLPLHYLMQSAESNLSLDMAQPLLEPLTREDVQKKDAAGKTLLRHAAAIYNAHELIPWLIDKGGKPNERDNSGNSPLFFLVPSGRSTLSRRAAERLLDGLTIEEVSEQDERGFTLLDDAHYYQSPQWFIDLLKLKGGDLLIARSPLPLDPFDPGWDLGVHAESDSDLRSNASSHN